MPTKSLAVQSAVDDPFTSFQSPASSGDPFTSFQAPDYTANPKGEGIYLMQGPDGKIAGVPYGNVVAAQRDRYTFKTPDVEHRFLKDNAADPNRGPMFQPHETTLGERLRGTIANSAIGHSLESAMPGVADALSLHPTETVYSPTYKSDKEQILAPQYLLPDPQSNAGHVTRGVLTGTGELTSGKNLSIAAGVAATAGLLAPVAAGAGAVGTGVRVTGQAARVGMAAMGAKNIADDAGRALQQYHDGHTADALESAGAVLPNASLMIPELGVFSKAAKESMLRRVAGGALDETIPGDTITPRDQYDIAQRQGVNLDLAQATGGRVPAMAKRITEHSMFGSPEYEKLRAANTDALHAHIQDVMDQVAPEGMSREDFGNAAKRELLNVQRRQYDQAGEIFKELSTDAGATQPKMAAVREAAQNIVAENSGYYDKHPELLRGGTASAWRILQDLATDPKGTEAKYAPTGLVNGDGTPMMRVIPGKPAAADTWNDLHRMRSDLMDFTRSPDISGGRPEGWLKQMTGAVDKTMTGAASGLSPSNVTKFRRANEIYRGMKETFDTPQSLLYSVVRAPDGLSAADMLARAKPEVVRYIAKEAAALIPQMQRQAIARMISPAGNDLAELRTLPARFNRAQKEQLGGILTPAQLDQLENIARTTRYVNTDSNPSGTAKVMQPGIEASSMLSGAKDMAVGTFTGRIGRVASGAAQVAAPLVGKRIARAITNPETVGRVMKGPEAWMQKGASNLSAQGLTNQEIAQLRLTPEGRKRLEWAGSASPNSKALLSVVAFARGRRGSDSEQTGEVQAGPDTWMQKGAANLAAQGVPDEQIAQMRLTPRGRDDLSAAGSISPGSKRMRAILAGVGR